MAEIKLSILQGQCLDRRIPDEQPLEQEIASWKSDGIGKEQLLTGGSP